MLSEILSLFVTMIVRQTLLYINLIGEGFCGMSGGKVITESSYVIDGEN